MTSYKQTISQPYLYGICRGQGVSRLFKFHTVITYVKVGTMRGRNRDPFLI